ncbi:MAG: hypothetical protein GY757_62475, partial [bacterium]|nr:hypothetical protein [bacterium]
INVFQGGQGRSSQTGSKFPPFLSGPSFHWVIPGQTENHDLAKLCELVSWAESGTLPEITKTICETILRFQSGNTVIEPADVFPLPWGTLSYLSCTAAYNFLCIINAALENIYVDKTQMQQKMAIWFVTTQGITGRVNRMTEEEYKRLQKMLGIPVEAMLKKTNLDSILQESQTIKIRSGDFIVLHYLHRGLLKSRETLKRKIGREPIEKAPQNPPWETEKGMLARILLWIARLFSPTAGSRPGSRGFQKAITLMEETVRAWKQLDPLAKLVDKHPTEEDAKKLSIVFSEENAEGFQYWLIKKIVPLCTLFDNTGVGKKSTANIFSPNGAIHFPAWILKTGDSFGDNRKRLRALLSILRLYSFWLETVPPLQDIEKKLAALPGKNGDEYRAPFLPFFEPWLELKRVFDE